MSATLDAQLVTWVTKRTLRWAGIRRITCEQVDERPKFLSYFDPALNRREDHLLEVPGSLVPEQL